MAHRAKHLPAWCGNTWQKVNLDGKPVIIYINELLKSNAVTAALERDTVMLGKHAVSSSGRK